jgi:NTP pyrophosphatase (non-canonical NTP hydrolase)
VSAKPANKEKVMSSQFIKDAIRTESAAYFQQDPRVVHAAMGLVTESAELMDALKKATFYGRELDVTNIKEEAGDILWYLAILFDALGTDFEAEQSRVIAKLKARFPDKFTEKEAFTRDLITEREILESM